MSASVSTPAPAHLGVRFALTYLLIAGTLFTIYAFPFELFGAQGDWLSGYLAAYAKLAGFVLGIFERDIVVSGTLIHGRFPLEIARNCDAADVNILFASAVLAFPAPLRLRLRPLVLGLLALVGANVLRICCLYYVGVYSPGYFKVAHEEIWPLIMVAFAALSFLSCVRYVQNKGGEPVADRA